MVTLGYKLFTNCLREVFCVEDVGPHGLEEATSREFGIRSIGAIDGASA
jgi:hypothetical protein